MKKNTLTEKAYVLITPARNEGAHIAKTIKSVVSQTVLPEKWVIVNDGSSDHTADIVNEYAAKHHFIKLVNISRQGQRNFGSKARAFKHGHEYLRNVDFGFFGNLDADVEFGSDYFEKILENFHANPQLGLAGGIILEYDGNEFIEQNTRLNSVSGAVQLFRYQCYEQIGGYLPLELGGIDAVAETMARQHGWEVQTFAALKVLHHRRVAAIKGKILPARFRQGVMNYSLGYHPLFQLARCLFRIKDRPYFSGSLMMLLGYGWASFLRHPKAVPDDFMQYLRSEQKSRLGSFFRSVKSRA